MSGFEGLLSTESLYPLKLIILLRIWTVEVFSGLGEGKFGWFFWKGAPLKLK